LFNAYFKKPKLGKMEKSVNVWKANLTNGIILGLIAVIYTLIMYYLDLTFNKVQGYAFFGIEIIILYFLLKTYRNNYLHGYMTYGQAIGAGMVIFVYVAVISAIFTYILYAIIDPGLIEKQLAAAEEIMLKKGLPQAQIDAGLAVQQKIMKPGIMAPMSIFGTLISGLIISLITGIFVRREGNPLIDSPENLKTV
jgi:hypothetical protein